MWIENTVMYQIYPIGFCGAPKVNKGEEGHHFGEIESIIPHLIDLGVNSVMLNPVLYSVAHGYDTTDFVKIDNRLGTADEFKALIKAFHDSGIKVVYDGVFNHVGRDFPQFKDVIANKRNSRYLDWFYIDFNGNTRYNDGFGYKDWQNCPELVKLHLENDEVQDLIFSAVKYWITEYDIDGIRLDAANLLPKWFFKKLKSVCTELKPDFPLIGEHIRIHEFVDCVGEGLLDSLTNYECYTGMTSSVNQPNFFEIAHSIERILARGGMFFGKHLLSFLDNHDVTRAASAIKNPQNLKVAYALMYALPGFPCLYYGSEYGVKGDKKWGDYELRPAWRDIDKSNTELIPVLKALAEIRKNPDAVYGEYKKLYLDNTAYAFCRGNIVYAFNVGSAEKIIRGGGREIKIAPHGFTVICGDQTLAF